MKLIWIILGVLIVGGVIIIWQETAPTPGAAGAPSAESSSRRTDADPVPVKPSGATNTKNPAASTNAEKSTETVTPGPSPKGPTASASDASASPSKASPSKSSDSKPSGSGVASDAPRALPTIPHAKVKPSRLERQTDGSIIADGRFSITGKGTKGDPYRVSWECLASAQETFAPRLNEFDLPERIAMLDGTYVRIDGYVAFPIMRAESQDLMIMLNQWDGCCIGVPPTVYDCIEVKLAEPVTNTQRHASFTFGSVTGLFKVDPFMPVENWLSGLYLIENATYEPEGL